MKDEKQLLEDLFVAQTLIIAEQIRVKEGKNDGPVTLELCINDAVRHIEKHREYVLTALRSKDL